MRIQGLDLSGLESSGLDLSGIQFSGLECSGHGFSGLEFSGLEFDGLDLSGLESSGLEVSGLEVIGCEFRDSISTESSSADWILGSNFKSSGTETWDFGASGAPGGGLWVPEEPENRQSGTGRPFARLPPMFSGPPPKP